MEANITARRATLEDKEKLQSLFRANSVRMQRDYETNFEPVAARILSNIAYGLVIVAEMDGEFVGFMMFTYEWSDWRDGVFLWIQAVESTQDEAYGSMQLCL